MPDACPDRTVLAAWSEDRPVEGFTPEFIERHLEECPRCGSVLDELTRVHLGTLELEGLRCDTKADGTRGARGDRVVVEQLIHAVLGGGPIHSPDPLQEFMDGWDPPARPGMLGRFAGYELERMIGRGGMGVVFRAFDPLLQRRVALKVLLHERRTADDEVEAGRFLTEARAIAALRHEHVVEVYVAGREGGWPFLVMPLHEQGTLQQWMDEGRRVTTDDVAQLAVQLLRALEFTHGHGILHRDLKPSNVLLERDLNHVRLADFGLARAMTESSSGGGRSLAGTPEFMSPEQFRGEPLDGRSDLFGLGALLRAVMMYAGRRDDAGGKGPAAAMGVPSSVARELRDFLERLLAPEAVDRPADALAARRELEAVLSRTRGRESRNWSWRRWAWMGGVLLLVVTGFVAVEQSGRTSVVNGVLCWITGSGYHVPGRWGAYDRLDAAAAACRPGEKVVARFDGERAVAPFRVGSGGLWVQAASGFLPVLVSTNSDEALILAQGPVTLEGLTLLSRSESGEGGQLIAAEGAPIRLVHCRLLRLTAGGDDVVVRSGRRAEPDSPQIIHKPLLTLRSGSSVALRRSVMIGLAATGIGVRCNGVEPIRVEIDQSLLVVHRGMVVRPEVGTPVTLRGRDSAFASASLVEIESPQLLGRLTVGWERCLIDRSGGVLLRWSRGGDGAWRERVEWTEAEVVYAGAGAFAWDRRRGPIASEAEWNRLLTLSDQGHRTTSRPLFGGIRSRSSLRLEAADVDVEGLSADTGWAATFRPEEIGVGAAYEHFHHD